VDPVFFEGYILGFKMVGALSGSTTAKDTIYAKK
jgi:hypothetical protein